MYTPPQARATNAYKRVGVETSVQSASPHRLVHLLYQELLQCLTTARGALARNDVPAKGAAITKAVRILDEGLKSALNVEQGGDVARNLGMLYDYCIRRLTLANVRNDDALLAEVRSLIEPVAQAWTDIGSAAAAAAQPKTGV